MRHRMKITLDEVKYIQTEIEKILHIDKGKQNIKKNEHQITNSRFATATATSHNRSADRVSNQRGSKSNSVTPEKKTVKSKNSKTPLKTIKQKVTNKKINNDSKSKEKEPQSNQQQSKKNNNFFAGIIQNNLNTSLSQINPDKEDEEIIQVKPTKSQIEPTGSLSTKQISKKFDQMAQKNIQKQGLKKGKEKPVEKSERQNIHSQEKAPQAPNKNINLSINEESEKSLKKSFPFGLINIKKEKKVSQNVKKQEEVLYPLTERARPYHLTKSNDIPIRDEGDYLQRKFKQKKERKQKKQDLILKYHVLDQRLNKLREEIQCQPVNTSLTPSKEQKRLKSRKNYKQALKKYLRYSPLNKLIKTNEKLKTQFQRSVNTSKTAALNSQKVKALYQDGRPLWVHP